MNRTLRVLIVTVAVLVIASAAFLMGFGSAFLMSDLAGQSSAGSGNAETTMPAATPVASSQSGALPSAQSAPGAPAQTSSLVSDVQSHFALFWEALKAVSDNYYDQKSLDVQKLVYGAIAGALSTINDPYTYFSQPQQVQRSQEDLSGSFEGIGATIETKDNRLLVVAPISGTPAQRAGLKPGDWITKIDGKSTDGLSVTEGVNLIRGKRGTTVLLTITRDGTPDPFEVPIVRDVINVPNVKMTMLGDGIAHLQLVNVFSANMGDDVKKALQEAKQQGADKIILDVRDNPGGYLRTSIEVASQFLKDGVVAYELLRDGKKSPNAVIKGGLATDWPIVVLVNKGSASASEILAGAIQDSGRGPLIGEQTFGKGSVQQDFPLSDGSAVHVTIANWLTPKLRNINKAGLKPDIEVKLTDDDAKAGRDPQLQRAIEYLTTGK
jgi:carboxyl-terminal processing protease